MIEFPLSLRSLDPGETPGRADAWLLPGDRPEEWVRALCASGIEPRLMYLLPASSRSRHPAGLFVALTAADRQAAAPERALAYTLSGRLYHPASARLRFPLTEAEFASLFLHDLCVLHPGIGLVGFNREDAVTLGDLLSLKAGPPGDWSRAHPEPAPLPARLTLTAELPPAETAKTIFEEARDYIGSEPPAQLPRLPDEESGAVGELKKTGQSVFYRMIRGFTRLFPETAAEPTWVNRLDDWAQKRLEQVQDRQKQEIDRLLRLLASDPDRGLRFALPLGGNAGRGLAQPGTQLPERPVDFNLRHLAGGSEVSPWRLDWEQMQRLMRSYREAANRELRLGRHRRAAYIFGHLLDDYESAANALKQGGFHREAAFLYRKHLNQHHAAAVCLKEGGLFEEAIALYEELGEHEEAGDLHAQLGHPEDAAAAWKRAVQKHVSADEPIKAALILEQKLEEPDRSLKVLRRAWPRSRFGEECLREYFRLHHRLDRHEEALAAIDQLRDETDGAQFPPVAVARVFCEVSRFYGQSQVVHSAQDAVRVVAGRHLSAGASSGRIGALEVLRELDPGDLLLARDTRRFEKRKEPVRLPPALPEQPSNRLKCERIDQDRFIRDFTARVAVPLSEGFLAYGQYRGTPSAVRYYPSAFQSYAHWEAGERWHASTNLLPQPAHLGIGGGKVTVRMLTHFPLPPLQFQPLETGNLLEIIHAGPHTLGMAYDELGGLWSLVMRPKELMLTRTNANGELTSTHHLTALPGGMTPEDVANSGLLVPVAASGRHVYFGFSNFLGRFDGNRVSWTEVPSRILQMAASPPHTRPHLVLALEEGAGLIWADRPSQDISYFAQDAHDAVLTFTKAGQLIVAAPDQARVYFMKDEAASLTCALQLAGQPISALPGPNANQFYLVTAHDVLKCELRES